MDREQILRGLAEAERHLAEGRQILQRQRALLEQLRANQATALAALEDCLKSQELHTADRDRLQQLLDSLPPLHHGN